MGFFKAGRDLIDALPSNYGGWIFMGIWSGSILFIYHVLLYLLCNSWKTSGCGTYTMARRDITHFSVDGGQVRHLEGCFMLPRTFLAMYLYSDIILSDIAYGREG